MMPGLVLDPSSGAGTTALAARQCGQDAVGVELNPEYVEIASERLASGPEGRKPIDFFLWGML